MQIQRRQRHVKLVAKRICCSEAQLHLAATIQTTCFLMTCRTLSALLLTLWEGRWEERWLQSLGRKADEKIGGFIPQVFWKYCVSDMVLRPSNYLLDLLNCCYIVLREQLVQHVLCGETMMRGRACFLNFWMRKPLNWKNFEKSILSQVEAARARRKERLKKEGPARAEQSSCDALEVCEWVIGVIMMAVPSHDDGWSESWWWVIWGTLII
jgi:hypothetical protein